MREWNNPDRIRFLLVLLVMGFEHRIDDFFEEIDKPFDRWVLSEQIGTEGGHFRVVLLINQPDREIAEDPAVDNGGANQYVGLEGTGKSRLIATNLATESSPRSSLYFSIYSGRISMFLLRYLASNP